MRRTEGFWVAMIIASSVVACGGKIDWTSVPSDGECGGSARCQPNPGGPTDPDPAPQPIGTGVQDPGAPPPATPKPGTPTSDPSKPLAPEKWVGWTKKAFVYDRAQSSCQGGERFVRKSERYGKWVGVELCSATRYKIFLGETLDGTFHEIGDFAGHGQDHCELVNPDFTIPNEDDITSGGCPSCDVEMAGWDRPGDVPVYSRGYFGEAFELHQSWPQYSLYTSLWYECGVAITEQ